MFRNIFGKFFKSNDSEQLKLEQVLKSMTVNDVVREFDMHKKNKENKQEITSQMVDEKEEVVSQEVEKVEETQEVEESIQDVQEVSEETEVVEEQPSQEVEENEPTETEAVETPQDEQEEPEQEPQEEVVEKKAEEEKVEEEQVEKEVVENEQSIDLVNEQAPENSVEVKITEQPQVSNDALLKEIEQLKAEKAEKEIELQKMNLAKEIEQDYAGVPVKLEEKVDLFFEIKNSELSEDTKSFIFNSLKTLSANNIADCKEIGHEQEVEVDEKTLAEQKVQNAMKEYGLTENQAFLFVNGDRTLAEAKKASDKVRKNRK